MNFFLLNFSFKLIESINQSLIINLLNSKTSTNAKKIKKSNSNQLDSELLLMKVILSQRNQIVFASLALTTLAKLNDQKRLSQISHSIAKSIKRIRKKSKQQLMYKSQKRKVVFKKKKIKTKREIAIIKKKTKKPASQKKNISKLTNRFELLLLLLSTTKQCRYL